MNDKTAMRAAIVVSLGVTLFLGLVIKSCDDRADLLYRVEYAYSMRSMSFLVKNLAHDGKNTVFECFYESDFTDEMNITRPCLRIVDRVPFTQSEVHYITTTKGNYIWTEVGFILAGAYTNEWKVMFTNWRSK